jgi:flagellar motor switch protein FliN/FliY
MNEAQSRELSDRISREVAPIMDVPVDLEVVLDKRIMRVEELLGLQEGQVVALTRSAGENIDLYVSDRLLASGEIVVIENSVGIRVTDFATFD